MNFELPNRQPLALEEKKNFILTLQCLKQSFERNGMGLPSWLVPAILRLQGEINDAT